MPKQLSKQHSFHEPPKTKLEGVRLQGEHGQFLESNQTIQIGGKLVSLYCGKSTKPIPIMVVESHSHYPKMAIANQQGEVFILNLQTGQYDSLQLSTSMVTTLCFIHCHKRHLIIAYENSSILIVSIQSKEIIGNIQLPERHVAHSIRSHPTKPWLIIASNNILYLWDLSSSQLLRTLECSELIMDMNFELNGDLIAICLHASGLFLYSTDSFQLLQTFKLPGCTGWTSYAIIPYQPQPNKDGQGGHRQILNILLTTKTNKIVSWYFRLKTTSLTPNQSILQPQLGSERICQMKHHVLGLFDLPSTITEIIYMKLILPGSTVGPRLLLQTKDNTLLTLENESFQQQTAGLMTILGSVPSFVATSGSKVTSATPVFGNIALGTQHMITIGQDSIARIFHLPSMINCGEYAGKLLKAREISSKHNNNTSQKTKETKEISSNNTQITTRSSTVMTTSNKTNRDKSNSPPNNNPANNNMDISSTMPVDPHQYFLSDDLEYPLHLKKTARKSAIPTKNATSWGASDGGSMTSATSSSNGHNKTTASRAAKRPSSAPAARGRRATSTSSATSTPTKGSQTLITKSTAASSYRSFVGARPLYEAKHRNDNSLISMPLFELAVLTPSEKRVNQKKLQAFLEKHSEYPSRYRSLIWRFLLKLPENSSSFADLVNRGIHPSFEDLHSTYPIPARKLFDRLQKLCSQLAHWAPILAEASYLPAMVFPFTLVHGTDELASLETIMTIMCYWGQSWHATHPNPPVHYVDTINNLLKLHEIKLFQHFERYQLSPGIIGWQMISTLFSEVLSKTHWLRLMDFLFTYFENTTLLILTPIALFKSWKNQIYTCDTTTKLQQLFHSQHDVHLYTLLTYLKEFSTSTPSKYFTSVATRYLDKKRFETGFEYVREDINMDELDEVRENLALSNGQPRFPLPKGAYPVYDGYPQQIVDLQIRERNKVLSLSKEVARRENTLVLLERKIQQIEADHQQWILKHVTASDTELKYQSQMMEQEKKHLLELQRIEEDISLQRMKALDTLEHVAQEEMKLMDQTIEETHRMLTLNEQHMKEKMDIQITLQKHRELAERAETTTMDKLRQLRMKRTREDWLKNLTSMMKHKEEELVTDDMLLTEKWKKQDEEEKLQRQLKSQQFNQQQEFQTLTSMQQEIQTHMQQLYKERELKLLEIERARALRLAEEQANEALESAERTALLVKQQEILQTSKKLQDNSIKIPKKSTSTSANNNNNNTNSTSESTMLPLQHPMNQDLQETIQIIQQEHDKLLTNEKLFAIKQMQLQQQMQQETSEQEYQQQVQQKKALYSQETKALQNKAHELQRAGFYTTELPAMIMNNNFDKPSTSSSSNNNINNNNVNNNNNSANNSNKNVFVQDVDSEEDEEEDRDEMPPKWTSNPTAFTSNQETNVITNNSNNNVTVSSKSIKSSQGFAGKFSSNTISSTKSRDQKKEEEESDDDLPPPVFSAPLGSALLTKTNYLHDDDDDDEEDDISIDEAAKKASQILLQPSTSSNKNPIVFQDSDDDHEEDDYKELQSPSSFAKQSFQFVSPTSTSASTISIPDSLLKTKNTSNKSNNNLNSETTRMTIQQSIKGLKSKSSSFSSKQQLSTTSLSRQTSQKNMKMNDDNNNNNKNNNNNYNNYINNHNENDDDDNDAEDLALWAFDS